MTLAVEIGLWRAEAADRKVGPGPTTVFERTGRTHYWTTPEG
jgi:hypothetical protein